MCNYHLGVLKRAQIRFRTTYSRKILPGPMQKPAIIPTTQPTLIKRMNGSSVCGWEKSELFLIIIVILINNLIEDSLFHTIDLPLRKHLYELYKITK